MTTDAADAVTVPSLAGSATTAWGRAVADEAFTVVPGRDLATLLPAAGLASFHAWWESLELDQELGGATYRYRRYGRLLAEHGPYGVRFTPLLHVPFQQDAALIPGYGGRARLFGPIAAPVLLDPVMTSLVAVDVAIVTAAGAKARRWEVGLHMIRIVARPGEPGLPTPEGRHQDGHDFISMHLLGRAHCSGGQSVVYREGMSPVRLTLTSALDSLVISDSRLTHEVTQVVADGHEGIRDMLLVDLNGR